MGTVGHSYIRAVYNCRGYMDIVARAAEMSMQNAVDEIKQLAGYYTKGEVNISYQHLCMYTVHVIYLHILVGYH